MALGPGCDPAEVVPQVSVRSVPLLLLSWLLGKRLIFSVGFPPQEGGDTTPGSQIPRKGTGPCM